MRNRWKKKVETLLLLAGLLGAVFSLTGCALAKEELQEAAANGDEILGVLVTVGEQEVQKQDSLEGQTFSSMEELQEALMRPTRAEGVQNEDGTVTFEGVEGAFLGVTMEEIEGVPSAHFTQSGDIFSDVKCNCAVTDEGTTYQQEATVKATPEMREPLYVNPVYKRSDGSVYVELDFGGYQVSGMESEGGLYSKTMTWESTQNINEKKESWKKEFTIHIGMEKPAETVRLKELNEQDEVIQTTAIDRKAEEFTLQADTAYVMVEEEQADGYVKRTALTWDEEEAENGLLYVTLPFAGKSGFVEYTSVHFQKEAK